MGLIPEPIQSQVVTRVAPYPQSTTHSVQGTLAITPDRMGAVAIG